MSIVLNYSLRFFNKPQFSLIHRKGGMNSGFFGMQCANWVLHLFADNETKCKKEVMCLSVLGKISKAIFTQPCKLGFKKRPPKEFPWLQMMVDYFCQH